jgi:hypothetical protein
MTFSHFSTPILLCKRTLLALAVASSLQGVAYAAAVSKPFESQVQISNTQLQLNGMGSRYKAVVKVYDLGLYTSRKVHTVEELFALDGPKRLQFVAQRDINSTDLGRMMVRAMSDNSSREIINRHMDAATRLIEIFSSSLKIAAGETFSVDFVPGKGAFFSFHGQQQGEPVGDAEFFNMMLRIWLGDMPVDHSLKSALLGQEKTTPMQ